MLEFEAKGTIAELSQLYSWDKLCKLIRVDYYNRSLVSGTEVFTITLKDLIQGGHLERSKDISQN